MSRPITTPVQSGGARIVRRGRRVYVCTENRTRYAFERVRATTLRGWPVAHGADDTDAIRALIRLMATGRAA
jgi:N-dimethylarginine dimethylaminohydrolase